MSILNSAGTAERIYPGPKSGAAAERSYPVSEVSGGQEETLRVQGQGWRPRGATQGAVAAKAQEGLEELYHIEVQEGQQ